MESAWEYPELTPLTLDMRETDEALHHLCAEAMRDSLTPMVALTHHGCEAVCAALATAAKVVSHPCSNWPLARARTYW